MRIQYQLQGVDPLMLEHMRRNIDFDNVDLLFMARKSLQNIEKSRLLSHLPSNVKMVADSMKDRSKLMLDKIDTMFQVTLQDNGDGSARIELFASPEYFVVADSLEAAYGRLGKRMAHFISRQSLIDGIEKSFRQVYGIRFAGRIVEDDGKKLKIGAT